MALKFVKKLKKPENPEGKGGKGKKLKKSKVTAPKPKERAKTKPKKKKDVLPPKKKVPPKSEGKGGKGKKTPKPAKKPAKKSAKKPAKKPAPTRAKVSATPEEKMRARFFKHIGAEAGKGTRKAGKATKQATGQKLGAGTKGGRIAGAAIIAGTLLHAATRKADRESMYGVGIPGSAEIKRGSKKQKSPERAHMKAGATLPADAKAGLRLTINKTAKKKKVSDPEAYASRKKGAKKKRYRTGLEKSPEAFASRKKGAGAKHEALRRSGKKRKPAKHRAEEIGAGTVNEPYLEEWSKNKVRRGIFDPGGIFGGPEKKGRIWVKENKKIRKKTKRPYAT